VRNLRLDQPKDYDANVLPRTRKRQDGYLKGPKGDVK
jgi:hypothetical protein